MDQMMDDNWRWDWIGFLQPKMGKVTYSYFNVFFLIFIAAWFIFDFLDKEKKWSYVNN